MFSEIIITILLLVAMLSVSILAINTWRAVSYNRICDVREILFAIWYTLIVAVLLIDIILFLK